MHTIKLLMLILGILGIADTLLILAISGGMNLGTVLPGAAGLALTAGALWNPQSSPDFSFLGQWNLKTFLFIGFCCLALSFAVVQSLILYHAFHRHSPETDWCIVLGAGLRGERPSKTLRNRLKTAASYLEAHPGAQVIVSGGQGRGESITEAEAMRRFLVDLGVDPGRIHLEDKSKNTVQNLRFSREIISGAGGNPAHRISVISSDFHLLRVRLLARRQGMEVLLLPAPTPWYLLPNTCSREYFALIKSFLLDR